MLISSVTDNAGALVSATDKRINAKYRENAKKTTDMLWVQSFVGWPDNGLPVFPSPAVGSAPPHAALQSGEATHIQRALSRNELKVPVRVIYEVRYGKVHIAGLPGIVQNLTRKSWHAPQEALTASLFSVLGCCLLPY